MKRCIFLLLILITDSHFFVQAQPELKKDSLLKLLPAAKDDSTKIMLLIKVSAVYATKNFDSAFLYMNKAKDFAKEKKITACDPYINTAFAEYYYYNNDYKNASAYALKNLDIAEKKNNDKLRAKTYNNLAAIYNHFGNYRQAIDYALKCLELSEKTKDSASFPIRNLTASNTYYNLKQYDKTILYSKKAIEYGEKFNNTYAVMMGLNNMATAYTDLHKIDSGIYFYTKQLDIAQREEDAVNTVYALINLSYNNFKKNNVSEVEKYIGMLDHIDEQMPDKKTIAEIHGAKALGYILKKEYPDAKGQLDSGIAIAIQEDATDALGNLYNTYSKFYFTQNRIKEAEDYAYKYDSLQSTLNLKELNFYTEDLEAKYETQKKEAQIQIQKAQLHQKNTLNYVLAGSAVAVLLISLLSYRNYKNRQKLQQVRIDELETEKHLTATEAVLKGEEQERTRLAKDLHDGLGGMLSGIKFSLSNMKGNLIMTPDNAQAFERSIDMLDSSIKEMRRVAHNMMPEVLVKYGLDTALKEFCNEIDRSGVIHTTYHSLSLNESAIEQTTSVTIYRIVQELVNNAIKHAAAKNVLVQTQYSNSEKLLSVTVEDDGKGFDTAILKQATGIGWSNIQNRVEFLKGKIDVQSGEGKGTSVLIEINV
ncbi:MAG: sensor histidine kinase [Bacteroidetes bacterium]|nr:sensor histidine kinase [Bacteroidota bacterium]MBS1932087.1 sensor histidine kinase [Bacteroidota bacterium]